MQCRNNEKVQNGKDLGIAKAETGAGIGTLVCEVRKGKETKQRSVEGLSATELAVWDSYRGSSSAWQIHSSNGE